MGPNGLVLVERKNGTGCYGNRSTEPGPACDDAGASFPSHPGGTTPNPRTATGEFYIPMIIADKWPFRLPGGYFDLEVVNELPATTGHHHLLNCKYGNLHLVANFS